MNISKDIFSKEDSWLKKLINSQMKLCKFCHIKLKSSYKNQLFKFTILPLYYHKFCQRNTNPQSILLLYACVKDKYLVPILTFFHFLTSFLLKM